VGLRGERELTAGDRHFPKGDVFRKKGLDVGVF